MPTGDARLLRQLLHLAGAPAGTASTDGDLLERFVRGRDELAFRELLRRHSALVFGVCRRVVRQEQDAEDAFQATFLVLARKAGSIRCRASLASWLHGVAYRCAARIRSANARRRRHEAQAVPAPATAAPPDLAWCEVRQALDEELARLPEKYRAPLVLCYLRGMTQCEAAQELGWRPGVLRGRLDRGRERLRARLARRGLALSAGLLAAALATEGTAAVPPALTDATLKAALLIAAGKTVADVVSGPVAALTKGALQAMLWTKIKIGVAGVLALGALGVGAVLACQPGAAGPAASQSAARAQPPDRAEAPLPSARSADKPQASKPVEKRFEFEMRDKPWSQVIEWYGEVSGLGYVGTSKPPGTFTFITSKDKRQYTLREITDLLNEALLAQKYILIRRSGTFTVLPADEKIDPSLVPRVRLDELGIRAQTELVSVELPLTSVRAEKLGPDVKKLLGPFGEVVVLETGNRLIIQDMAGNVERIVRTVTDIETDARSQEKK